MKLNAPRTTFEIIEPNSITFKSLTLLKLVQKDGTYRWTQKRGFIRRVG